jgi:hypothetical protein
MRRHLWLFTTLQLCGLFACFRELGSVQRGGAALPSLTLEVRDQNDALWDTENTPRVPVFFLQASEEAELDLERRLFLLRDVPSPELLADLRSTSLRATTEMARVALRVTACAGAGDNCAAPRVPLEAGARYTLVWATVAGAVQFPIAVSRSPAAGAALIESLPGELSGRVPINLARVLVRFDGYLAQGSAELSLYDAAGQRVPTAGRFLSCAELGLPPGDCFELLPSAPLAKSTRHTVQFSGALTDVTGAGLLEREIGFTTAAESDARAPALRALDCAKDEQLVGSLCALPSERSVAVRARSDESGYLTLSAEGMQAAAIGATADFELTLPLASERALLVSLSDLAGNTSHTQVVLAPAPDLARLAIDEVRVDPLGPEPAQEYVEVLNFGASDVSMMGFSLTHDPFAQGLAIADDITVAPGERVLVVPPEFDARESSDGALPAGVRLARLARPLALRNEGSALYLRDAQGRRLSASPALGPEQAGQCIHRVDNDPRSGDMLAFARDASGGCTPGAASTP